MARQVPGRALLFLVFLFTLGLAVTLFAFVDLNWTHWILIQAKASKKHASIGPLQFERLRRSILDIRLQCEKNNFLIAGLNLDAGNGGGPTCNDENRIPHGIAGTDCRIPSEQSSAPVHPSAHSRGSSPGTPHRSSDDFQPA